VAIFLQIHFILHLAGQDGSSLGAEAEPEELHSATTPAGSLGRYNIDRVILEGFGSAESSSSGPYIDLSHSGNVTVVSGHLARLNCRVRNLGNRTVSWIRLQDLSLLTVGRYTYTSDLRFDLLSFSTFFLVPTRFEGIHAKHSPDWQLALKNTRLTDSGALGGFQWVNESAGPYECQVSTSPHMAHVVHLRVRDPVTRLVGGPEMFVESSSMINLTCLVAWTAKPPDKVVWLHNGSEVTYNGPRTGVSLIIDKSEVTTVTLLLQRATSVDSGSYTCRPDNGPSASTTLHVLQGDKTGALSRASQGEKSGLWTILLLLWWQILELLEISGI